MKIYKSLVTRSLFAIFVFLAFFGKSMEMRASFAEEASNSGFWIKKVVSDTTIATGQAFSYTIYYSIPAGATNVTISDAIPTSLMFISAAYNNACGTPAVSSPAVNQMGGVYSLTWASIPTSCTGSFTITVAFPNGITCPGTGARNRVCLTGKLSDKLYEFCTDFVSTVAIASNPWHINKYPLGVASQGGNCQYATGSDTISYQICVYKNNGTTGQLDLTSGIVRDTLPAGALLVSSNCGAVQNGNVITWNVGNLSANQQYNTVCCQFKVKYPSAQFPAGSQITNSATLSGSLGSPNQPCGTFSTTSNQTCVQLANIANSTMQKWVYTNGQPGCSGRYVIQLCNTGTIPLHALVLDTLPSQLTNYSVVADPRLFLSGNILQIMDTVFMPGVCHYYYVDFTIPTNATVGSTITNCASIYFWEINPQYTCTSFTINAPAPKPCLWKEVCSPQTSYLPGSTFRYRLRIQNIGGLPITGASITDQLNPNLEYVGNPSYYTSNTWNTPCTTQSNWQNVNLIYNSNTNLVNVSLPTIPAACQDIFYSNCGMYGTGGVPYYFIEFDVKVRDTSALGNIPNEFSMNGGTLGTSSYNSNTVYVLVHGTTGFSLEKGIKKPNDQSYVSSMSVTPGSTVNYRLKLNSTGTASLRHVTFADLLPNDAGTADSKILQMCSIRGSQFDVTYTSLITSNPTISQWNNPFSTGLANVNNLQPTGLPSPAFNIGCGTNGTWSSGWTTGIKNIAAYFGSNSISPNASLELVATVSPHAQPDQTACNTFAASGFVKHLIQSNLSNFQLAGQSESSPVCLSIDNTTEHCIDSLISISRMCIGVNSAGHTEYSIQVIAESCLPAILNISSPDGNFTPSTFTLTANPWTINTTFERLTTTNPIEIYYTISCENGRCTDTLRIDLPPCDDSVDCCTNFYHNIKSSVVWTSAGTVTLNANIYANQIDKFSATIVSAQLRKRNSSWQRIFGDITGGSLMTAPALGPQLLNIYSREAIWGPGECIDWSKGAILNLKMLFPPVSNTSIALGGYDTLRFSIRYSFRDCKCQTCDTLITYTVVRKWKPLPWFDVTSAGLLHFPGNANTTKSGETNTILSETPDQTSLIMDDFNNGNLWIISPNSPDNDAVITGIEITSPEITLSEIKMDGTNGVVLDNVGFIQSNITKGQNVAIQLIFNNSNSKMQFPVSVRYFYKLTGSEEEFTTESIIYTARVPNADPDKLDIDLSTKPSNVSSYAIYIDNSNGYKEGIYAISLKPTGTLKIIAVGPVSSENGETYFVPNLLQDGSYIITVPSQGDAGINAMQIAKPIFLTLSGVDANNSEINFTTFDINMQPISQGSFTLSSPISAVQNIGSETGNGAFLSPVSPNPAMNSITVSYSLNELSQNIKLSIIDIQGKEVKDIVENKILGSGTYIQNVDISNLPSGYYMIILRTNKGVISKSFSVVR